MTLRSGMAGQIIFGEESAWGVYTAPTRAVPFVSESLAQEIDRIESDGIIAGQRIMRSTQWDRGDVTVGGDVQLELLDRSIGLLFKHLFGSVNTTGPASGLYTHTFTPGTLTGLGLTAQVGRPGSAAGVVDPWTYTGGKIASAEIAFEQGQVSTLGLTLMNRHEIGFRTVTDGVTTNGSPVVTSATAVFSQDDVGKPISGTGIPAATTVLSFQSPTQVTLSANATATATGVTFSIGVALVTATYASGIGLGMTSIGARVTIGGTNYKVKSGKISIDNGLEERRFADDDGIIAEPFEGDLRMITGEFDTEYFDRTAYNRYVRGQEAAVVVGLARGTSTCQITMNTRFDGDTPNIDGRGVIPQKVPFKAVGSTNDASAITAVLVNTDSTP